MTSNRRKRRARRRAESRAQEMQVQEDAQPQNIADLVMVESPVEAAAQPMPPAPAREPETDTTVATRIVETVSSDPVEPQEPSDPEDGPPVRVAIEVAGTGWRSVFSYHRVIVRRSAKTLVLVHDRRRPGQFSYPITNGGEAPQSAIIIETIPDSVFLVEPMTVFDDRQHIYVLFKIVTEKTGVAQDIEATFSWIS